MTRKEVFKELKDHIITSISTSDIKLINVTVAMRIIEELINEQYKIKNVSCRQGVDDTLKILGISIKQGRL